MGCGPSIAWCARLNFAMLWTLFTAPRTPRLRTWPRTDPPLVLGFFIALGAATVGLRDAAAAIGSGLFAFLLNAPGTVTTGAFDRLRLPNVLDRPGCSRAIGATWCWGRRPDGLRFVLGASRPPRCLLAGASRWRGRRLADRLAAAQPRPTLHYLQSLSWGRPVVAAAIRR